MGVNHQDLLSISSNHKDYLYHKIKNKTARIGVIGLGYVGLPTAFEKAEEGYDVIGFDVSDFKVKQVNGGKNYINDIDDAKFNELTKARKKLSATTDFSILNQVNVVLIKDIGDMCESPILPILDELANANADIKVCDPFINKVPINNKSTTQNNCGNPQTWSPSEPTTPASTTKKSWNNPNSYSTPETRARTSGRSIRFILGEPLGSSFFNSESLS